MRDEEWVRMAVRRAAGTGDEPEPRLEGVVRRARKRRRFRLAAVGGAWLLVLAGIGVPLAFLAPVGRSPAPGPATESPTASPSQRLTSEAGPVFQPANGWFTRSYGPVHAGAVSAAAAWASTIPFSPKDEVDTCPDWTLRQLPTDGIGMCAWLPLPDLVPAPPDNSNFPDRHLPLQLSDAESGGFEGQPAPTELRILARVNDQYVEVDTYFGTAHPSAALVARAQDELNRLQLPSVEPGPVPLQTGTAEFAPGDGLWVLVPHGWSYLEAPSGYPPAFVKTDFAISNVPIPRGGRCIPIAALNALPPDGVLAWVRELRLSPGSAIPQRSGPFSLNPNALTDACSTVPYHVLRFSDQSRDFEVDVALGPRATEADRDQLLSSLSTLQVDRCPPATVPPRVTEVGTLTPDHGSAGTTATFSGLPTGRDENWFWVPSKKIEFWWSRSRVNIPVQDTEQLRLATINPGFACTVGETFRVPDVPPGRYLITVLIYFRGEFGWEAERTFTVTR